MKHESATVTTYKVVAALLVSIAGLYVAYKLKTIIVWLIIGAFFAIMINPAVSRMAKRMPRQKRGFALAVVLAITLLALAGFTILFITPLIKQTAQLVANWPSITANISSTLAEKTSGIVGFLNQHGLSKYLESQKGAVASGLSNLFLGSISRFVAVINSLIAGFTILVITIYFSLNGPQYFRTALSRVPASKKKDFAELTSLMYKTITGYINGNLLTSLVAAISAGLITTILGIPYAAVLGLIVGVTDLIPLIGAQLGAIIVITAAYFQSPSKAIIMLIFFILYQSFENYVLSPKIMSRTVNISPMLVFLFVICGATLAGFVGALIAIPTGACIMILADYLLSGTVWDKD